MNKVHFTSNTCEWYTPSDFYEQVHKEFNFELDVCATKENAKCVQFYTKEDNGLLQEWSGICWMNPPYGREIKYWIQKAYQTALSGCGTVVCLIPSRTDTQWWHDYVIKADEIRFIKGRLKFGNSGNPAPFPSALVVFKKREMSK